MLSNPRKHSNSYVEDDEEARVFELPKAKRVKESDASETSSESNETDAKLNRMAQAVKTLLEVS